MLSLAEQVRRTVLTEPLFGAGDGLVVGLSGGADSVALVHLLLDLAPALGARVCGLAHLNHQLRPSASADEAFCRGLADRLALPIIVGREDVAAEARRRRTSIEDAARIIRYTFLNGAAETMGASRVAVAHTRNDQAETVLLRLFRGAGPSGLAGIRPRRGRIVRPLLEVTRSEIEGWLVERNIEWREDPSNRDVAIPRNRIRHELLPWLVRHFGAGVVDVLSRQAALSSADGTWLNGQATEIATRLVLRRDGSVEIEAAALAAVPLPLQRRVVFEVLRSLAGERFIGVTHVDASLALLQGDVSGPRVVDLPGQRLSRDGARMTWRAVAPDPGREGRRRGRPVSKKEDGADRMVTELPTTARQSGAEGATLKGHAPKGGRG